MTFHQQSLPNSGSSILKRGTKRTGAILDSRTSISIIGQSSTQSSSLEDRFIDPIEAAKKWLDTAHLEGSISSEAMSLANKALAIAVDHCKQVENAVQDLMLQLTDPSMHPDSASMERLEQMVKALALFSQHLRMNLEAGDAGEARLTHAIEIGNKDGFKAMMIDLISARA